MNILIIDDSSSMRRLIRNIIDKCSSCEFEEARNGQEALEMAAGKDLIISDWNMPHLDGLSFTRAIKRNPDTQNIPVIMISADSSEKSVMEALNSGVHDYIIKPFTEDTFIQKIEHHISKNGGSGG